MKNFVRPIIFTTLGLVIAWQFIAYPVNDYLVCSKQIQQKEYALKSDPNIKFEIKEPEKIKQFSKYYEIQNSELHLTSPIRFPGENIRCFTETIGVKLKNSDISFEYRSDTDPKETTPAAIDSFIDNYLNTNRAFQFEKYNEKSFLIIRKYDDESSKTIFSVKNGPSVTGFQSYIFFDNDNNPGKLDFANSNNSQKLTDFMMSEPDLAKSDRVRINFYTIDQDGKVYFDLDVMNGINNILVFTPTLSKNGESYEIQKIEKPEFVPEQQF